MSIYLIFSYKTLHYSLILLTKQIIIKYTTVKSDRKIPVAVDEIIKYIIYKITVADR